MAAHAGLAGKCEMRGTTGAKTARNAPAAERIVPMSTHGMAVLAVHATRCSTEITTGARIVAAAHAVE